MKHVSDRVSEKEFCEAQEAEAMDIKGDFSDYDRIFYQQGETDDQDSLLLFSVKKQLFTRLDLKSLKRQEVNIDTDASYAQVEIFDHKIFCISRNPLMLDVFFPSKKRQFYHRKTIYFANKELQLKEEVRLFVWKNEEVGEIYRFLVGPLKDGRYMNFDLSERYFDYKAEAEKVMAKVVFVSLTVDDDEPQEVDCALDEGKKSILCFGKETDTFFEYNDFLGEDSKRLSVIYKEKVVLNKLKRMYFYYPYDFFSQKEKNQLKTAARNTHQKTRLDSFVRDRYREVLMCMERCSLLKMSLLGGLTDLDAWTISRVDENASYIPNDIAPNRRTGEIYCLCRNGIHIMENSGRKPDIVQEQKKTEFYNTGKETS